jgi:hypothetical protein
MFYISFLIHSHSYTHTQRILQRCSRSVELVNQWLDEGALLRTDDEIWRATVDVESLEQMLATV